MTLAPSEQLVAGQVGRDAHGIAHLHAVDVAVPDVSVGVGDGSARIGASSSQVTGSLELTTMPSVPEFVPIDSWPWN